MPHTITAGQTFPLPCPACQKEAGMPFIVSTVLKSGAMRIGLRCRDCGHEWQFDLPVQTPVVAPKPDRRKPE